MKQISHVDWKTWRLEHRLHRYRYHLSFITNFIRYLNWRSRTEFRALSEWHPVIPSQLSLVSPNEKSTFSVVWKGTPLRWVYTSRTLAALKWDAHCVDASLISRVIRLTNQHTRSMQRAVSSSVRLAEQPLKDRRNLERQSEKLPMSTAAQYCAASVNKIPNKIQES